MATGARSDRSVRTAVVLTGLFVLLAVLFLLRIAAGSVAIPAGDVLRVLFGVPVERASVPTIIHQFRIPRAVAALLAGSALGVSGATMQTMFRNPLAGPFVLGVNAGASLGAALVLLGFAGSLGGVATGVLGAGIEGGSAFVLAFAAFAGAAMLMLLILAMSRIVSNPVTLLVIGILAGYAVNAVVSVMIYSAGAEQVQSYIAWTFGSFAGVSRSQLPVLGSGVIIGLVMVFSSIRMLDASLLGERYAESLGVSPRLIRRRVILSTAFLAGPVTAFCGPIAFIGMATPHLVRALTGRSTHRILLWGSFAAGGALALGGDIIASVPGSDISLPLNAITALFGAPVVIGVLLGGKRLETRV
ncbi:MAG: iron chelate uptake ABC transporter family permease subunit [Spirochaetia bacterium]